ncbi:ABC transporter substrate-binding protein [Paenibacillus sp. WLX1005]|uniref:ABC transporter substrate-binding protein n=1 Tax=Paenibacillus sp. WLX1005 TaxID=3243766 RepID=UPI0039842C8E
MKNLYISKYIRYRSSLLLIVIMFVIGGCSSTQPTNNDSSASSSETTSEVNGEDISSKTRTFTHKMGTIQVPEHPKRVIGLYVEDQLQALGVKPVMQWGSGGQTRSYLNLQDVPVLDVSGGVNFEAVLSADPDLIILFNDSLAVKGGYEQFSAIAPTYVFDDANENWRESLTTIGDLLQMSDQATEVIKQYDQQAADSARTLQQAIGNETVALLRIEQKGMLLYGGPSKGFTGPVLYGDLQLQPDPLVRELAWEDYNKQITMETIPELTADHIFIVVGNQAEEQAEQLYTNPLWQNIPAVQKNHVHEVDFLTWMSSGPIANSLKIKQATELLQNRNLQ